ncbi:MAG: hypothetical protein EP318_08955 [Rhodobacteraceae bacterium]|nr:MAG: hypothetical protein EP318_08955 [Paracoccaceae bacterium]
MTRLLLTLAACLFGLAAPLSAQGEIARAEFLPGWRQADGSHVAGLLITLQPGWKTYWRAPGEAGIPPRFDWAGSRNVRALRPVWPTPQVMDQNGMTSIGYPGDVVIPFEIRPENTSGDVRLEARMELGVCKDICVPASLSFAGTLGRGGERDPRIVAALVDQPLQASEARVGKVTCDVRPVKGGIRLEARIAMPPAGGREFVVVESANPSLWVAEARSTRRGGDLTATTELAHVTGAPFALDRSGLRFTVLGSSHAVDIRGCAAR